MISRLPKPLSEQDFMEYDQIQSSIGRINNPLLHLPLKNGFNMPYGTGSVTFTRSTTGTYVDRYGVVKSAAINAGRFEKEGLLMEGSSTNKILQSEDFSTTWTKSLAGDTISTNSIAAPDGNTTADGIIGDNTTTVHGFYQANIGITNDVDISLSVFAKPGTDDWVFIQLKTWDVSWVETGNSRGWFNVSTGVLGSNTGLNFTNVSSKIVELANGWYRCEISFTIPSGTDTANERVYITSSSGNNSTNSTGDGTSVQMYFWGAQLEELPFSSSYIPTTTTAVTRAADFCYVTYAGNMPDKNNSLFSILCDVNFLGVNPNSYYYIWRCYNETYRYTFSSPNDDNPIFRCSVGGSADIYFPNISVGETKRYGFVYEPSSKITGYLDGVLVHSLSSLADVTGNCIWVYLGYSIFGHISNFRIYDIALTEQEMKIA